MSIANTVREVSLTSSEYLNIPATSGISTSGHWFYYVPVNSNNDTLGAAIKPYQWNNALSILNSQPTIQMEGTVPFIQEVWEGTSTKYHGSSIENVGAGVNDITATVERDAFFFGHLGSLAPATDDDAFYWDRAYLGENSSEWDYYQYHKHLPLFYPTYENGRQTMSARGYINPEDKAYGYMINSRIAVMGTDYASVLARIHTPSIGGAHNSHNDVTLPTTSAKNYMPGGIIKGNSNRFHCFYITANGSDWDVFTRTYTQSSLSFTGEVNLGTYNLADPSFNPSTNTQHNYPVRASAGAAYGVRIYFPVIFNNATSGFDLKIWSLNSLDTIAGGSLIQYTLVSGAAVRPDCHLLVYNNKLYACYTDPATGGVSLQSFDGTTWTSEGQVVTNSNTKYVRVHGFEHNPTDAKFYALLSGTSLGGGSYAGPGMYSFEVGGTFTGYPHLDYNPSTNSFTTKPASNTGYVSYDHITSELTKHTTIEPAGIADDTSVLEYTISSPKFINRKESILGGEEFYYQGIELTDGRRVAVGRITQAANGFDTSSTSGDLLVSVFPNTNEEPYHFAWGGAGDDYITGVFESPTSRKLWLTGYTKSELVEKKDMKVHGFVRNFTDGSNQMDFVDVAIDSNGNMYAVGNHDAGYIILMKFNANYELVWQTSFDGGALGVDTAYSLVADTAEEHVFIAGKTTNAGEGGSDALLIKANCATGRLEFAAVYGSAGEEYASSIALTRKAGTDFFTLSVVSGTSTIFVVTDHDGVVLEQNSVSNLVVNRLRRDTNNSNGGQFLFAGNNGAGTPSMKFGMGVIDDSDRMIKWVQTYTDGTACYARDIDIVDADEYVLAGSVGTSGYAMRFQITESSGTYTLTKTWANKIATTAFNSLAVNSTGVHVVGYTTASGVTNMAMDDGFVAKYSLAGTLLWQNAFGHDMDERLVAVRKDPSGENIVSVGWSESHSFGRDAVLFRCWTGGFGTGLYHIEGNPGVPYIYQATSLTGSSGTGDPSSQTAPSDIVASLVQTGGIYTPFTGTSYTVTNSGTNNYVFNGGDLVNAQDPTLTLARGGTYTFTMAYTGSHPFWIKSVNTVGSAGAYNEGVTNNGATAGVTLTFTVPHDAPDILYYRCGSHSGMGGTINIIENPSLSNDFQTNDYGFTANIYDGSYGPSGVFMFWLGYIDLDSIQTYLNSEHYLTNRLNGIKLNYTSDIFQFYQVGTVGDGTADDGNIFGYDIIEASDGTIYAIGQTSGDVSKTNTGTSGVYDYIIFEFDPVNETFDYYQNGTSLDEETYALCELANGKIAYTGRTSGNLGGTNQGGYDVFLGIFDPTTETSSYYNIGSGLDDKGVNVHDLGANTLAVVYSSYGALGNQTNTGTEDIGVVLFNYSTGTWGTAYQTGSTSSEFFEQNGKPSVLMDDNEHICIVCSSAGSFSDDQQTYGLLDMCLGILNLTTGTWTKYQVGSGATDFTSSVHAVGERLIITGYSRATFADSTINGTMIEFDASYGFGGKTAA
jgi:hypothetical protein